MKSIYRRLPLLPVLILGIFLFANPVQAQTTLTGKVFDAETKELLVGVNIYATALQTGTITSPAGTFSLHCPAATDSISISYMGYECQKICLEKLKEGEELAVALKPTVESLQPIVVTASRNRQERSEAPVAISSLPAKELEETKPTLLTEVMNKVPGVLMVNLGNEQHSMSIRQPMSLKGYFLYLEDGLPIRPAGLFNHNALIEVNMFGLSGVEVVRGPASSIYGSEAIGGAVNFLSMAPSASPGASIGVHADQWGYRRTQFNAGGFVTKKLGIFAGGYLANQQGSWQGHSDFSKFSINIRADYFLNEDTKIIASFSNNVLDSEMGGSLDSAGFYGKKYNTLHTFTYRKVDALRAKIALQKFWHEGAESKATLFFRNNSIAQLPAYAIKNTRNDLAKANGEQNISSFRSVGLMGQHSQEIDWANAKILGGLYLDYSPSEYHAHYISVEREAESGRYIGYTAHPDSMLTDYQADLLNTAAYLQLEVSPVEKMKLVAGTRWDRVDYQFNNFLSPSAFSGAPDDHRSFTFFTPKAGIIYNLVNGTGLYGNISRGAYAPGINELYRGVKVPALTHANFMNYEAGIWSGLFRNKLYLEACFYVMKGRNEIVSYTLEDGSTENRNSGQTLHKGVEYSLKYKPSKQVLFRLGGTNASHTFVEYSTRGESDFSGNEMPNAPNWIANAEISYYPQVLPGFRTSLEWQRVSSWYVNDANESKYEDRTLGNLKGISVLHFRTGYSWKEKLEFYVNVTNLTDELYAHNSSRSNWGTTYSPAAGRTFSFGAAYHFNAREK